MVQIDDLTDEPDPINIPATSAEHPNWRRKLSLTLEELAEAAESAPILREFQNLRRARPVADGAAAGPRRIRRAGP